MDGVMRPLRNEGAALKRFVVIGDPDSNRVGFFQDALARLGLPLATVVSWTDLLTGQAHLRDAVTPRSIVRIESPGKSFEIERALIALGADEPDVRPTPRLSRRECAGLEFDKGRILAPRQWFLGLRAALAKISSQLADCPEHRVMNAPSEIEVMFDKTVCHRLLSENAISVAPGLGATCSHLELCERMQEMSCRQVFVKLAHGSSASGIIAYRTDGKRHQAITTAEMVENGDELRLYNSRHVRTCHDQTQIARLIDALCRHGVHVEQWIPKAGIDGQTFDLRVVMIAGQERHIVVRMSKTPMTNLHLLNRRGDVYAVRARMGEDAWASAMQTCRQTMHCFPGSLYAGIDLLIANGFQKHAVLEVNAFGDLLPNVLWNGRDTYTAEIEAVAPSWS